MMDGTETTPTPGSERRGARVRVDAGKPALKGKHTLMFDVTTWERLNVHALRQGVDCSELVGTLINTHLRRYVIQDRGGKGPAESPGPEKDPVETLPVAETLTPSEVAEGVASPGEGEGSGTDHVVRPKRRAGQGVR